MIGRLSTYSRITRYLTAKHLLDTQLARVNYPSHPWYPMFNNVDGPPCVELLVSLRCELVHTNNIALLRFWWTIGSVNQGRIEW